MPCEHDSIDDALVERLGPMHARARLGIEREPPPARWFSALRRGPPADAPRLLSRLIRGTLKVGGLYRRGQRNALDIRIRAHAPVLPRLDPRLDGLRLLHLSDLHLDENPRVVEAVRERVADLDYDFCVLTGDYRFGKSGGLERTLAGFERLRDGLAGPVYAVLGNHDSAALVPGLEALGIRLLMNEHVTIAHNGTKLYLAGVDDPHHFQLHNLEKAAGGIPNAATTVLLAHSPELYRQAAHAGFDLLLSGHTHGGQICLPGGIPLRLEAPIPRRLGAGPWAHGPMLGYTSRGAGTSLVDVRFNCRGEITVHVLRSAQRSGPTAEPPRATDPDSRES